MMIKKCLIWLFICISTLSSCIKEKRTYKDNPYFEKNIYTYKKGENLPYRLLDTVKNKTSKQPLLVIMHGANLRGSDNIKTMSGTIEYFKNTPAYNINKPIVLIPQCPIGYKWVNIHWDLMANKMPDTPTHPLKMVDALIDNLIKTKNIDTYRIYLVGNSMGGFAVYDLIIRHPKKYTAALAICGGGDERTLSTNIETKIWAFHGQKDHIIHYLRSVNMYQRAKELGLPFKLTIYKDEKHNILPKVLADTATTNWLFGQTLPLHSQSNFR